jgi:hypothetical protein
VPIFASGREAKEYLVGRIVEEARREGLALSKVETKMLYFSETAWTLPDMMDVNETFERDYDAGEYEQKVGGLIRRFRAEACVRNSKDLAAWDDAVAVLRREDHYLLVLIGVADGTFTAVGSDSPDVSWRRFLKLMMLGFGLFLLCAVVLMMFWFMRSRA